MTEIDNTTGLPVLPEGYFWRVNFRRGPFNFYTLVNVSLRKKNLWRTVVAQHETPLEYLDPRDAQAGRTGSNRRYDYVAAPPEDFPEFILKAAEKALKSQADYLAREAYNKEVRVAIDTLAGDYPPKTLVKE